MIYPSVRERGRLNIEAGETKRRRSGRFSCLGFAFASMVLLGATGAQAASYYVTQSGSGSGNGSSPSNAWSVATFNSSTVPTGGDTVFFSGTISSSVRPNKSGTGNGTSRLTLDFKDATLTTANPRINISGKSYLNINGGTMGSTTSEQCINITGSNSNITVQDWKQTASETNTGGFVSAYYCDNLVVANNNLTNTRNLIQGDSIMNHDITIANNYAKTSVNTTAQTDIVFLGDAYNVTIEGNKFVHRTEGNTTLRHNDIIQTYKKGGSNAGNPGGWVVRYNWFELDVRSGTGDTSWMMMAHMKNNNGKDAIKIYGNVFYGTPTDSASNNGVLVYLGDSPTVRFYNNTIIRKNDPDNTVRFIDSGTYYAQNNVGGATAGINGTFLVWSTTPGKVGNNWFYNFKATSAHTGTNGGTTDPQFVDFTGNNFNLKATSPAIGKGDSAINLSAEYGKGVAPDATWPNPRLVQRAAGDVGAFATGASVTPTPPADSTPPAISALTAAPTNTGATVSWTTDEASSSRVEYGATTSYGAVATDAKLGTAHSLAISGLTAGTTYHYRVQSTDAAGNTATSADGTFSTAAQAGQLAAQPTSLSFGQVTVGSTADLTLKVSNTGGTSISGTATVAAPFSIVSGGSYTVAAGQSQAITVRYSPTAATTNSGTVALTGGSGSNVPVTGTGASSSTGGTGGTSNLTSEAEAGTLSGPFVSSNGAISQSVTTTDVASSGRAAYTVNVPEAGQYSVVVSLSAPNTASNSLFFNIDAEPVDPTMIWDIPVTTSAFENRTGAWRGTGTVDQAEFTPKYFDLTAGTHQLIIRGREAGVKIDKVSLVKKAVAIPVIEAESGTISSPFVVSSGTVSQSQLTTTVSTAGRASYKINVPEAGQYAVVVTLAAPSAASNSLFFNIDAEPVDPTMVWDIPVTNGLENRTGAWRGNGTVDVPELSPKYFDLTAGTHELIIRGRESGVKLDKVTLVKRPSSPEVTSVQ
ncbi:fibronectin type III domain-containing protein [Verrucomicrobiota bacterium sgz303538]